jgi:O-antigen/teichoic acid export membrane protein
MYGIWQMLGQMTGYARMADTRATQVLKWSLASKRDIADEQEFKSDVTTALVVTAISLPIALIIGGIISWYAPIITQADLKYYSLIRITCSILILCLAINKFFDLFEAVLGGMNLGYKRMGFRAVIVVFGGVLKVLTITQGFGLIGLSVVQIIISVITGYTFYRIVKKQVPWFEFGKTNISKVKSFGKLSGWYMAFTTLKMFLLNSDKIILGYIIGPIYVAKYTLTMFTSTAIQGAIVTVITGITPGISSLYGKKEFDKVRQARKMIMSLAWLLSASIGCTILMINKSFINLWVGKEHYAGNFENLLILLIAVQVIFFQIDSFIITVTLNMKRKVLLSTCAATLSILLSFLLVGKFQIAGLCFSILIGRLFYTIGFPRLLKKQMQDRFILFSRQLVQPLLITITMFILSTFAGVSISISNWFILFISGMGIFLGSALVYWFLGINSRERTEISTLISKIKFLNFK